MRTIICVAFIGAIALCIGCLVRQVMDLPIVEISNSTASCVRVWTPAGEGSCDRIPERYELVFVQ